MTAQQPLSIEDVRAAFPYGSARLAHIEGVLQMASMIEIAWEDFDGKLEQAALYHDIGYAKHWNVTGFHPVDGAIAARDHGLDETVAQAILYHSGSWREAQMMCPDLCDLYASSCRMMDTPLNRAITYCDMHIGPQGQQFTLDERLADIKIRHATNQPLLGIIDEYYTRFMVIDAEWKAVLDRSSGNIFTHRKSMR